MSENLAAPNPCQEQEQTIAQLLEALGDLAARLRYQAALHEGDEHPRLEEVLIRLATLAEEHCARFRAAAHDEEVPHDGRRE